MLTLGVVKIISQAENAEDTGTGIVVGIHGSSMYILTAFHVVEEAKAIQIVFSEKRDRKFEGQIYSEYQEDLDIAVIVVNVEKEMEPPSELPEFSFTSAVDRGDKVSTIGHPLGSDWQISINANTITRLDYQGDPRMFCFTKSAIERGNSGGPVFNEQGRLIGMLIRLDPICAIAVGISSIRSALDNMGVPMAKLKNRRPKLEVVYKAIRPFFNLAIPITTAVSAAAWGIYAYKAQEKEEEWIIEPDEKKAEGLAEDFRRHEKRGKRSNRFMIGGIVSAAIWYPLSRFLLDGRLIREEKEATGTSFGLSHDPEKIAFYISRAF